jgi:hypothetical protein
MTTVVFSKDRALQLDAFLRSYRDHVTPLDDVQVLCRATSPRHRAAYEELFDEIGEWVRPCWQGESFKEDLLDMLPDAGNVVFFVDDMVFLRPWTVFERAGLSLRLGTNLTRDYASGDAQQDRPSLNVDGEIFTWRWADGELAWGYPLALDGHVFDLRELRPLLRLAHFSSPNTLESALQQFVHVFRKGRGACYLMSKVVNVPWNRVQTDWHNRCGEGHDAEAMLAHWEAGQHIDLSSLYGVVNESTHQEFPLHLEVR